MGRTITPLDHRSQLLLLVPLLQHYSCPLVTTATLTTMCRVGFGIIFFFSLMNCSHSHKPARPQWRFQSSDHLAGLFPDVKASQQFLSTVFQQSWHHYKRLSNTTMALSKLVDRILTKGWGRTPRISRPDQAVFDFPEFGNTCSEHLLYTFLLF